MKNWAAFGLAFVLLAGAAMAQPRKPGDYPLTADSLPQPGIAHGTLIGPLEFHSKIFAGTVRRYWVYLPANYNPKNPPNLLVFQGGQRATNPHGPLNIPVVLDNLIAKHEIPQTLGVFITPGNLGTEHYPGNLGMDNPNHRAEEYDAVNDNYTRFLLDELLPKIAQQYSFTSDPARRIIGGTSSGAICAFTVAWNRPDAFGNVISDIGSFTSIGYHPATADHPIIVGGDIYPTLIRKNPIRPLHIFLQDGTNDLDNEHGNWHLANEQMLSALQWANSNADSNHIAGPRYDIRYVWGDGNHSDDHGGQLLPQMLRWMFGK